MWLGYVFGAADVLYRWKQVGFRTSVNGKEKFVFVGKHKELSIRGDFGGEERPSTFFFYALNVGCKV